MTEDVLPLRFVVCPEDGCDEIAAATDPVPLIGMTMARVVCVMGHTFRMPVDGLADA